jgi:hypothetical protein
VYTFEAAKLIAAHSDFSEAQVLAVSPRGIAGREQGVFDRHVPIAVVDHCERCNQRIKTLWSDESALTVPVVQTL